MKGFILAAGKGTRLKPWTDSHPKALFPVRGVPMLQRVIERMHSAGIKDITVNVFHFAEQIIDFLGRRFPEIKISDERPELLETGGAILNAAPLFAGDEPVLVHNVDILSNADFTRLEEAHLKRGADVTLLVSDRESNRRLIFSRHDMRLIGWQNRSTGEFVALEAEDIDPELNRIRIEKGIDLEKFQTDEEPLDPLLAFSGIYIISPGVAGEMKWGGYHGKFRIMDFLLDTMDRLPHYGYEQKGLKILDIGKPDTMDRAENFLRDL